jgi:hypothetical protein
MANLNGHHYQLPSTLLGIHMIILVIHEKWNVIRRRHLHKINILVNENIIIEGKTKMRIE